MDFAETPDGAPYIVMEYLEGAELSAIIERVGAMPMSRVLPIVSQIAAGLQAAHDRGIVHRDLKPQNIFLVPVTGREKELCKIVDFGISKVRAARTSLTQAATVMGTPQYMAPEQALGQIEQIDPRTDQFALAAITYEMVSGRLPFRGESLPALMYQVVHADPPPMDVGGKRPNPAVESAIRRGLAKQREQRFPSVMDFAVALETAVAHGGSSEQAAVAGQHAQLAGTMPPGRAPQPMTAARGRASAASAALSPTVARRPTAGAPSTTLSGVAAEVEDLEAAGLGRRRGPRRAVVAALGLATAAAGAFFYLRGQGILDDPGLPFGAPAALKAPEAAPASGPATAAALPAAAAAPAASPSPAPNEAPPAARAAETVTIDVEGAPPGLLVKVDGARWELPVRLPRGPKAYAVRFEAPGYDPDERRIDGTRDRTLMISLHKQPTRARHAGGGPASAGAAPPASSAKPAGVSSAAAAPPTPVAPLPAAAPAPTPAAPKRRVVTDL